MVGLVRIVARGLVVGEVFAAARTAFWRWPILWMPPLMAQALQALAGGPFDEPAVAVLMVLMAFGGSFLIEAGWLAMIVLALRGGRPAFAFLEGVNRHWATFLVGNAAYVIVLVALAAALVALGEAAWGHQELERYLAGFQGLSEAGVKARLRPEAIPAQVQAWSNLVMAWGLLAGLFTLGLSFWQPLAVAGPLPWHVAWWRSLGLALRQSPRLLGVGVLHAAGLLMALLALASGGPGLAFLGVLALLSVVAFFKLVYAAWALRLAPPPPLPAEALAEA